MIETDISQTATSNDSDNHKWKEKLQFQTIQVEYVCTEKSACIKESRSVLQ